MLHFVDSQIPPPPPPPPKKKIGINLDLPLLIFAEVVSVLKKEAMVLLLMLVMMVLAVRGDFMSWLGCEGVRGGGWGGRGRGREEGLALLIGGK